MRVSRNTVKLLYLLPIFLLLSSLADIDSKAGSRLHGIVIDGEFSRETEWDDAKIINKDVSTLFLKTYYRAIPGRSGFYQITVAVLHYFWGGCSNSPSSFVDPGGSDGPQGFNNLDDQDVNWFEYILFDQNTGERRYYVSAWVFEGPDCPAGANEGEDEEWLLQCDQNITEAPLLESPYYDEVRHCTPVWICVRFLK